MAFKPITLNTPAEEPAHILAEDDAAIYESIIGGDCVLPIGGLMKATVLTNNKVRITDGAVVVGGHVGRIVKGDYEDMTIANGQTGQNRNDIIAARFLAGADGGSDSYSLVVIQGTPGSSAADPVIVKGDLYAGDKQRDYPLWRVCLEGLSITKVEQMHEIGTTNKDLSAGLSELDSAFEGIQCGSFTDRKHGDTIVIKRPVRAYSGVIVLPRYNTGTSIRCNMSASSIATGGQSFTLQAYDTRTGLTSTADSLAGTYIVIPYS
ncbi:MAG TPA: hypothetical protein H9722_00905 [Candidatus Mediterraneibacter pullistercoris]|nr:hypothetical protein [Candidatus Mediterraneibacter pullistercoris]